MSSPSRPPQAPRSPCVNICRMDAETALCEGCLRTLDEISAWSSLDDSGRRAILRQLPTRRTAWRKARRVAEETTVPLPGGAS